MTTTFEEKIEILREKFFFSSSQANVSDIAESFIFLTVSFNSRITEDEVKQTIRRVKADKASSASSESCRTDLSTDEFIQRMCNTQVLFEAVQKDSDNSTTQIEEK